MVSLTCIVEEEHDGVGFIVVSILKCCCVKDPISNAQHSVCYRLSTRGNLICLLPLEGWFPHTAPSLCMEWQFNFGALEFILWILQLTVHLQAAQSLHRSIMNEGYTENPALLCVYSDPEAWRFNS